MNLETLAAIAIVCILIGYCVRSNRIKTVCSPQFKCCHAWDQSTVWTTNRAVTHRLTCKKCGKTFTQETAHHINVF